MIHALTGLPGRIAERFAAKPAPVLPPFRPERSWARRFTTKSLFIAFCVFLGIIYGFVYATFPPFFMIYMGIPIILLAVIVIWALPDQDRAPTRLLEKMFFAYFLAMFLWPVYLSIALPGLPWLALRRVIAFPMGFVLLICLSTSSRFRAEMSAALKGLKPIRNMFLLFLLIQFLTIFLSDRPFVSFNYFINNLFLLLMMYFISAWAFAKPGRIARWVKLLVGMAVFLCLIGLAEVRNQQILWANHIPSFLQVDDPAVIRMLTAVFREQGYRVTTTFTVSLAFAEFLAVSSVFVLHWMLTSKALKHILLFGALDLLMLVLIFDTHARLGIIGWLAGHGFYGCIWAIRRWRTRKTDLLGPGIAIAYPLLILAFTVSMFTVDAVRYRTIEGSSTGYSDDARKVQFQMAKPILAKNPFGHGPGRSAEILGYAPPGGQLTVDTYVLTLALDYGILGLGLFAGMLGFAIYKMLALSFEPREGELEYALPVATALLVFTVIKLVLSQEDNNAVIYMLLGMASAIQMRAAKLYPATARTTDPRPAVPGLTPAPALSSSH